MNDKEFALNAAMNRMRKKLNHLTGDIESWKEDMVNDYAEFFRWHADDLYEAMAAKAILEPVYDTAKGLGLAALEESLRHNIEHLTDDLVYGDLERQSTGKMSNMAYGLELKAKQKMIQFFSAVQTVIAEGKKIEGGRISPKGATGESAAALDSRQGRPRMTAGKTAGVAGLPCAG